MLMQPPLALGQAVHEVIEGLSILPVEERFTTSLLEKYEEAWKKISGKKGGFPDPETEATFKARGQTMIERVTKHPGPLLTRAIKIRQELPYFWLSEEDNIILCGKIDWLEYLAEGDSVRILDFKTGKYDEDPDSLQLPIYYLLAKNCQSHAVVGARYWYVDRDTEPVEVALPALDESTKRLLDIAKKIQLARKLEHFACPRKDGCSACRPFEAILAKHAQYVGVGGYNQDIYILPVGA